VTFDDVNAPADRLEEKLWLEQAAYFGLAVAARDTATEQLREAVAVS
jgi:hypothetical protein